MEVGHLGFLIASNWSEEDLQKTDVAEKWSFEKTYETKWNLEETLKIEKYEILKKNLKNRKACRKIKMKPDWVGT